MARTYSEGHQWYLQNKDKAQERARSRYHRVVKTQRIQDKLICFARYNPSGVVCCSWEGCHVTDPDMLTLDHVDDDGKKRRKAGEGRGNQLYRRAAKEFIPGLQTLCANHNLKKEVLRRRELGK